MIRQYIWLIICLLLIAPYSAQENTLPETLTIGSSVTARIDDAIPRIMYNLNGSRGTIVRIRLVATSGSLDPVLSLFDPSGNLLMSRDDSAGSRNVDFMLTFQENGQYSLVVGRFAYALGTTSGEYELTIERVGVSSDEGSSLQYGIPITNTITNAQPRLFFTFEAQAGDIINISMIRSSGSLDPYIQLLDANRFLVAENDDAHGDTRNAQIQTLVIDSPGTYILVATRYGQASGDSAGSFVLTIDEASNSGLGNSRFAPAGIAFNQTITAELTENRYERFYIFEGQRDQIISISMDRTQFAGQLDSYLVLTNASFQPLVEDDDSGNNSDAYIQEYRLPASGLYYIIATRFERAGGTSFGEYNLTLTDEGSAFASVAPDIPRLIYGTSIEGSIGADNTEDIYVFWGTEGERVIIGMDQTTGDLDTVLELLDANEVRMLRDDDTGFENNARLDAVLTYTGIHYIRATRYDGNTGNSNTTGDYRLSLTRISGNED
ncbi:MAG: hypothetical protein Phog2KO_44250 [Phototrophicaceae bacterium]